ncbi:hypothetical protein BXZ70DRAFT_190543 [Cristinia sonorae]|uniref:BTB domain-containing protein n=1 Tax=Cristinia sonorae TaxID=1940300 RepID=A0A8K0XPW2_9AGAR|nr:hypothetical protein BXZ70DRAFT_190543 [Cristinia sonorae]
MATTQDIADVEPSLPADQLKPHAVFHFDDLFIAIENDLFKVPRRDFENNSTIFQDMYSVPIPKGTPADGSSSDCPLRLAGVTSDEFVTLLKAMYPPHLYEDVKLSADEWQTVLRMANMWQFQVLRNLAISRLQPVVDAMSAPEALSMARKYDVDSWLENAVDSMARRAKALNMNDVEIIGIKDTLKVAHVREQALDIVRTAGYFNAKERGALDFRPTIRRVFGINAPK